eukprot:COSAG06_NODE_24240_length_668_cov_1.265378_1_plen_55_part_00
MGTRIKKTKRSSNTVCFPLRAGSRLQLHQARGGENHPHRATNGAKHQCLINIDK